MKKLMFAAALSASVFSGTVYGDVSSANIVGYTTVTLAEQWTILGVNFTGIGGEAMDINTAVPYVEGMTKGGSINTADQIQIQNGKGGYTAYYMSNGLDAKDKPVAGLEGKWALNAKYTPATDKIPSGTAFWYCRKEFSEPLTLTVAGEVSKLASSPKEIKESWVHIANPYPTDLPLNDGIPFVEGMTKGGSINTADQIQIQNGKGGYTAYYMSNGLDAKDKPVAGLEGKWALNAKYTPTTDKLPAGKGAWFARKGATDFTITIQNPLNK